MLLKDLIDEKLLKILPLKSIDFIKKAYDELEVFKYLMDESIYVVYGGGGSTVSFKFVESDLDGWMETGRLYISFETPEVINVFELYYDELFWNVLTSGHFKVSSRNYKIMQTLPITKSNNKWITDDWSKCGECGNYFPNRTKRLAICESHTILT